MSVPLSAISVTVPTLSVNSKNIPSLDAVRSYSLKRTGAAHAGRAVHAFKVVMTLEMMPIS